MPDSRSQSESFQVRQLEEMLARETAARQRLEESLRASEARFRSIARNLTEMVLSYDMDRRLTFVNAAAEALTGYSPAELEAKFICWVHPADRECSVIGSTRRAEFSGGGYRLVTRDGRVRWMERPGALA
jgi:PAS domain S-box-containing protein